MKKIIAMLLCLVMLLALAACGGEGAPETQPTPSTEPSSEPASDPTDASEDPTEEPTEEPTQAAPPADPFCYTAEGVKLIPGQSFDASALPEASSIYTVPSCAIEGMDNVYSYDSFEVTAFHDGTQEIIYSIWFSDPNLTTDEGLALGDNQDKMVQLYGEDFTMNGTAAVYTHGDTQLSVMLQDGTVIDIQYLWIAN